MYISTERQAKLRGQIEGIKLTLHYYEIVLNTERKGSRQIEITDLEDNELCDIASNFRAGMKKGFTTRCEEQMSSIRWTR